jgi:hypothetical protein
MLRIVQLSQADGSRRVAVVDEHLEYGEVYEARSAWRLAPPIDHSEPCRCHVMGTGLTHKGSAENRQSMHVGAGSHPEGTRPRTYAHVRCV